MKVFVRVITALLIGFFILKCASAPKPEQFTPQESPRLSEKEAQFRAKQVQNVKYDLFFDLTQNEAYSGNVTLNFDLTAKYNGLRIDFYDGSIETVELNGQPISVSYNQHYLFLNPDQLTTGPTQIKIQFSRKYSQDGDGLHHFTDPKDGQRYLYTNLEPFDANKVFPCFDQPDVKANYKMKVKTPKNWQVITSVREEKVEKEEKGFDLWSFPFSAKFSTYIWSLHAGPYHVWKDTAGDIPLRLFARKSLASYVKEKDWFQFTKEGLAFYNQYFDYKYPFKKYDQLIVPEFGPGAMENVAAVTFNERFVSRGVKTQKERQNLSNVILHEMAHMWFGDLVTMKWWNDLWLNESFATYMAALAQSSTGEFKEQAWIDFNGTKGWAYWEDQLVTTHPIEAIVPNTDQAMANFDGITYGKGASSLKQLAYFIGPENFQKGVQNYFKKYAEKNTELKDFMETLDAQTEKDLKSWQKLWLQTSGVNTIFADFSCKNDKITFFQLKQSAPTEHSHIRPHALQVALLNDHQGQYKVDEVIKAYVTTKETDLNEVIGKKCPDIVYPNYDDHDYIKVTLDSQSLGNLKHGISKVESRFLRKMLWSSLWDMVVYAQLSFEAYGDIVLTGSLRNEKDPFILRDLLMTFNGRGESSPSVINFYKFKENGKSSTYSQFINRYESLLWNRLRTAPAGSELQKIFFSAYVNSGESPAAQNHLLNILNGKTKFPGLAIDQDKRWDIISRLASLGHRQSKTLIAAESKKDQTHTGRLNKISAEASLPDWKSKIKWINKFTQPETKESDAVLRTAIYSLFPVNQTDLRTKFSEEFYPKLLELNNGKEVNRARAFTVLTPNECVNNTGKLEQFIDEHPQLKPVVLKQLRVINQQYGRCRKAIELARSKKFGAN
ncbi:MAG: aminopeptidase N [Bdellovibrionales bacterium]|nr:aminopeptidase N [Bdellovibrionales bacterium]